MFSTYTRELVLNMRDQPTFSPPESMVRAVVMRNRKKESVWLSDRFFIIFLTLEKPGEACPSFFHVGFLAFGIVSNVTFICSLFFSENHQ